jgi:hypothetical protein
MDNITFVNKDEIDEKISVIMRQTDYDEKTANEKLIDHCYDHIKVIKTYLGITEKKAPVGQKSVNQEIYKQLRHKLDSSMKSYLQEQEQKLKTEIANNNNAK